MAYKVMTNIFHVNPFTIPRKEKESIATAIYRTEHKHLFQLVILEIADKYEPFQSNLNNKDTFEKEYNYWKVQFSKSERNTEELYVDEHKEWNKQIREAYFTDNPQAWNNCWY